MRYLGGLWILAPCKPAVLLQADKERTMTTSRHRSRITGLGVFLVLAVTSLAFAGTPVNPSTLNPPPPPQFNPVCEKDGNQTICTVQFSDPPFAGGSGVICGTGAGAYEVFQFQNRSVVGHRYYDQNGNLTRKIFREILTGTFSNPLTHTAVSYDGGTPNM